MPEPADLYEILQVHPAAHPEVIHAAYDRLAQIYHPDGEPEVDVAARMAEINRAYAVLNDPQWRAAYDLQRAGGNRGTGDGGAVPDVVRAKSFQLVNDAGQTRAELSLDQDGDSVLRMIDRDGKTRFEIWSSTGSAPFLLRMFDQHQQPRINLRLSSSGAPGLEIRDRSGDVRLWLGEADEGRPMLFTTDQNGKRRFAIYQAENGQQRLEINDQRGNARLFLGEADDGRPMVYTTDRNGKRRFAIYQAEYGQQWLAFNDRRGDVRLWVGEDDEGTPMVYMTDRNGQHRFTIYQDVNGRQSLIIFDEDGDPTVIIDEKSQI